MFLQQYWQGAEKWRYVPVKDMATQFEQSQYGRNNVEAASQPFEQTDLSNSALVYKPFALNGEALSCQRWCTAAVKD